MTTRIAWHPAFCRAIEIELCEYKAYLDYQSEFELSKEPLRIDLLVIKKTADVNIDKNIGRIFKAHNLLEYKSPSDSLTINDFYKILAYACQYKAIYDSDEVIPDEEITITVVCDHKPKKVMNYLSNVKQWPIKKHANGIYYVKDFIFDIQLIVRPELNENENFFLKCLTDNLDLEMLGKAIAEDDAHREDNKYEEFFATIYLQNADLLLEVISMKTVTPELLEKFERVAQDTGMAEKFIIKGIAMGKVEGEARAKMEAALSLLDLLSDKVIAEKLGLPLATVTALHKNQTS